MENIFSRLEILIGEDKVNLLKSKRVAIFGIGGVGGAVVEALARSGIGEFDLIDNDTVSLTNINRQIIATHDSLNKDKVDVMKDRILSINKDAKVNVHKCFFLRENSHLFDFTKYDYIVDAVDTVTAKVHLVVKANECQVPIISSMGAGNKMNPADFEVADIYKTSVCPLAKVMRHELKKRNIPHLKVVYSKENPIKPKESHEENCKAGSNAFVPSVVGLIIASEVIKDLSKIRD